MMCSQRVHDIIALTKPKVVLLMLFTSWVGMFLATHQLPLGSRCWFALLGIALCAGSGAVTNHLIDQEIDKKMWRTQSRPVAAGRVSTSDAIVFALSLLICGTMILYFFVNKLTMVLTISSTLGYALIYSGYLKYATTQNIVIGGLSGAVPPLLGWVAMTGTIDPRALLLMLIIFVWTPPHFWALALYKQHEYEMADVPMLPVVYGSKVTKWFIFLYSIIQAVVTTFPYLTQMSGLIYLVGSILLNVRFLYLAHRLMICDEKRLGWHLFRFSIVYLFALFALMMFDHYFYIWLV